MLNPFKDVNWNPGLAERRKFAVSLIIGFPIIALIMSIVTRFTAHAWKPFPFWLGGIGLAIGVVLWLVPQIAKPFYAVWYFIACCMGFVVGNTLLSAFYFLVVTPFGLVMRMGGRDPLKKKCDRRTPTYWRDAEKVVDLKRYYRQF